MRKRLLSMFLALSMVLTMLPAKALAVTTTLLVGDGQSYEWTAQGLYDAMAAAKTGDTVMLMGGTAGTLSFSEPVYLYDKSITLDLNGKTVEFYRPDTSSWCGIACNGTTVLTVTDSSNPNTDSFTAKNPVHTTFNANAGLIINSGTVGSINVYGSLTVNGGKVTGKYNTIMVNNTKANISITGGEIESTDRSALSIFPSYGNAEDKVDVSITGGILSAPGTSNPVININTFSYNGDTNITIGNSANVTATGTNGVALRILSQKNTTLRIESGDKITGGFGRIMTPDVLSLNASKEASKQKTINFTLKNPEAYKNPNWKLYTTNTGTMEVSGVSVASVGSTLTLTAAGEDLSAGNYYLAVAADPTQYYAESERTMLTVKSYVPPVMTGEANISGTPQLGQTLTLANNTSGGGTPVWYATDNNTATGGTQFANGVTSVQLEAAQAGKYIYVTVPADADHTGSVKSNVIGPVTRANGPAAPSITFSFDGTNANKLIGATALMEYSLDGGSNWSDCTADMDLATSLSSITEANDIKVRVKETDTHEAGEIITIDILAGSAIATGTITTTGCTTEANNDGTLSGVTVSMEYKKFGTSNWTAGTGNKITGLLSGYYLVRNKATGHIMVGAETTVTVPDFIPTAVSHFVLDSYVTKPAKKGAPVTTAINDDQYTGTVSWKNASDNAVTGNFLGGTTYTATITLTAKSGYTFNGVSANTFSYTGATVTNLMGTDNTLTVTIKFPATAARELSSIAVTTPPSKTNYKYGETFSKEGMVVKATYDDGTTDSAFTSYTVDKTTLSMEDTIVTLTANGTSITITQAITVTRANGPAAPSVTFSFDGTNANKLLGATALMEYSLDGGTNWENCTADMDLAASLGSITAANDIKVRVKETDTHEAGAVQTIDITQPSAPTIGKTDETYALNDGAITGVSSLMEYRKSGHTSYTPISGSTVTGLVPGEYLVRFKATGTVLASPDATVETVAFTKKTPTLADLTYSLAAVNYDGSAKPLTVTKKTAGIGDITIYYGGSITMPINAGTYAITVDIAGNAEYNTVAGLSLGSYTINKIDYAGTSALPARVLVSGQAGATITLPTLPTGASYGTPTASGTIKMTNMSVAGTTLTYTAPESTAGQTGRMAIPVTGATNYNNYNVVVTVTFTAKTPQVISFANSNLSKTYGDAKFTNQLTQTTVKGTITYSSDDVSVATVNTATGEVTILAMGDGCATITATAAETATHAQATASYTVTVAKKSLTLKADDKSITKGDGLPAFTYTVTGLVDGDAVTTAPTMSTAADGTATGTFDINIAGGVIANATSYDITYTNGTLTVAELQFAATITNGTGGGSYSEGATVTITANDRSGYTFTGWNCVDVTFANAAAKTTTFTMPSKAVTITANYRQNSPSSGGEGYIPPPPPIEIKVPGAMDITDKAVTEAFEKALAEAKKNSNEQKGITVVLPVDTGSKTGSNVTVNLPKTVQDIIIDKKIVNTILVVDKPDIRIGMDLTTVKEINRQANSDVNITATLRDSSKLTGDGAKAIGSRPVFDLKVNYGSGKQVQSFGTGSVSVNIPYALGTNEKAGNVQAVYVDNNGKIHWLVNSVYDSVERVLRFSTNHFSTYGVGYKQDAPSFTDIANHYRKEDIEFVAARGLLEGTGTTTFEPDRAITRGMLATALGRMANADVGVYTKSSFTDIKNDAYYMGYIEWANSKGIISGIDGKFSPDMAVTREHMAVILNSYAKAMGITLEKVYEEVTFADKSKISDYAKEAVKELQVAGIIMNRSNNLFDPAGVATRSEISAMLRRFIESTTGGSIPQGWIMNDSGKWMYYEKSKAVTGRKEISGLIYEFNQYGETASSPGKPIENTDKEQKEEKKEEVPKNPSTPSPVIYNTYRVKKGDSFWKISQKYKCSMYELAKINNKTIKDIIRPGEVLKIPKK